MELGASERGLGWMRACLSSALPCFDGRCPCPHAGLRHLGVTQPLPERHGRVWEAGASPVLARSLVRLQDSCALSREDSHPTRRSRRASPSLCVAEAPRGRALAASPRRSLGLLSEGPGKALPAPPQARAPCPAACTAGPSLVCVLLWLE